MSNVPKNPSDGVAAATGAADLVTPGWDDVGTALPTAGTTCALDGGGDAGLDGGGDAGLGGVVDEVGGEAESTDDSRPVPSRTTKLRPMPSATSPTEARVVLTATTRIVPDEQEMFPAESTIVLTAPEHPATVSGSMSAKFAAVRRSIEAIQAFGRSRIGHLPGLTLIARAAENRVVPRLADSVFRPGEHEVNGVRIIIPDTDGLGGEPYMVLGLYEQREILYLNRRLRPDDGIVDIGAHIGYISLQAAAAVGPDGFVLAVEPTPGSAELLRQAVRSNGFEQRVRVVEAAATDRPGTGSLSLSRASPMLNTLDALDGKTYDRVTVRLVTVDELLTDAGWPPVDVLKIDVEGHELAVLAGAQEAIERYPRIEIMFELQGGKPSLLTSSEETIARFGEMGFSFYRISDAGALVPSSPAELCERIRLPRWQDSLFNVVASRVEPPARVLRPT